MSLTKDIVESFRAMHEKDGIDYAKNFKPRESDVFIATYPKCGTNWVCQICHMLRSNGDMNHTDANLNYPWDILAKGMGLDLDAEQKYFPRLFKSHESLADVTKGAKYVNVIRDPADATVSMYNMHINVYKATPEQYPIEDFRKYFVVPEEANKCFGNIIESFARSIEAYQQNPDNVCWVYFEDLKENPKKQIRRIAEFIGIEVTEEVLQKAYDMSTLEYMRTNKLKLGSQGIMNYTFARMTPGAIEHVKTLQLGEVPVELKGVSGGGKHLPADILNILDSEWDRCIKSEFGYANYEDLRAKLK